VRARNTSATHLAACTAPGEATSGVTAHPGGSAKITDVVTTLARDIFYKGMIGFLIM
jgi:hypothetical protein